MAVTGYVQKSVADALANKKADGFVEVKPERDVEDVVARVAAADIVETRVGSADGGQTLVQIILRHGAKVETVLRTSADPAGFAAFHDPVLNRVRQEATAKKIMV
jgi:hypothetical protein